MTDPRLWPRCDDDDKDRMTMAFRKCHPDTRSTHSRMLCHQRPMAWASLLKTAVILWLLLSSASLTPTWGQTKIPLET
ncbi:hypothetical protein HPG69_009883 [Diceros bicornis minor]|uniref:Uncharacterized protein n=1 Tax=Diceros bicornis minor TaxID=77932 RepID=A0A7J7EUA7_DICBM|nr:hypothetical protein HPG69_009883 [Diceros bicornis minor]